MNIVNHVFNNFEVEKMHPFGTYKYTINQFSDGTLEINVFRYKKTNEANDHDRFTENKVKGRRINKTWKGIKTTNNIFGFLKELIGEDL